MLGARGVRRPRWLSRDAAAPVGVHAARDVGVVRVHGRHRQEPGVSRERSLGPGDVGDGRDVLGATNVGGDGKEEERCGGKESREIHGCGFRGRYRFEKKVRRK